MAVYLVLVVMGDLGSLLSISVPFVFIASFLFLAFANYLLRAVKWHLYSRELGVTVSFRRNLIVFLSGLSMTITPVRMGEVLKCYLLKRESGTKISRTLPAVVVERLTDIISLCLLSLSGILVASNYALMAAGFSMMVLLLLFATRIESFYTVLSKLPLIRRFVCRISEVQEGSKLLSSRRMVLSSILITVPAWFLEGVGLWVLLRGLGINAPLMTVVFIFSFSSVFGALSMLPGGLGAAEASFTVLLSQLLYLDLTMAIWVTIVTRLCTLWFGTGIGIVSLMATERLKNAG
jgi:uncharacterized protein (TIRG00374 family)